MYLFFFASFFLCAFAELQPSEGRISQVFPPHTYNGALPSPPAPGKAVISGWLNNGWQQIAFGPKGTTVTDTYYVSSPSNAIIIDAVDLYCPGDQFKITATPAAGGSSVVIYTSYIAPGSCTVSTSDPTNAFSSGSWSRGTLNLQPGNWNIAIYVQASPYSGGVMAMRARTV